MRTVLDTNVVVSGIFFAGPPAAILPVRADTPRDRIADTADVMNVTVPGGWYIRRRRTSFLETGNRESVEGGSGCSEGP